MKKVFIVDDEAMFANMLADFLSQNLPVETFLFETGEACLEDMNLKPDFVVLDFHLNSKNASAKNGMEILPSIRKNCPTAEVIMLSGQKSYAVAAQTISKGAAHYFIKSEDSFEAVAKFIKSKIK